MKAGWRGADADFAGGFWESWFETVRKMTVPSQHTSTRPSAAPRGDGHSRRQVIVLRPGKGLLAGGAMFSVGRPTDRLIP